MSYRRFLSDCKFLLALWATQSLSQLGSSMTGFALVLWSYGRYGSALKAPYATEPQSISPLSSRLCRYLY